MKKLTQEILETIGESAYRDLICTLAGDAEEFDSSKDVVDKFVNKTLKFRNLNKGLFLRRDFDGVSEVEWLIKKMVGEFLAKGKAEI